MNYISCKRNWLLLPGLAVVASLLLGSCTKRFEQLNTNPDALYTSDLLADYHYLGDPLKQAELNIYVATPAPTTQLQQNLLGDCFSGYMCSPTPFANNINNLSYALVNGWNTFPWDEGYKVVMAPLNYLFTFASATKFQGFFGVAKIIQVEAMHRVSDIYGPIVYNKFGKINADGSVSYDAQKDDYYAFFNDLDSGINALTPLANQGLISDTLAPFDLAYNGNYASWIKFANTLKLRLAIRINGIDPNKAKAEGEAALANKFGILSTNADNFNINIGSTPHPVNIMNNSWGDCRSGAALGCYLVGYHDPRASKYMVPAKDPAVTGQYEGIRQGINIDAKARYGAYAQPVTFPSSIQLMVAAEAWFLKAEAALNGWTGAGTIQTDYETGIRTSFDQYGLDSDTSGYIHNTSYTEAPYTDPKAITPGQNDITTGSPWLSTITIQWDGTATAAQQQERILTQKWLAMYPEGEEAWTEFRRTGYPKLFPVVINNSGGTISTTAFIRRINFAQSEINTNPNAIPGAVQLLGGPDNGGTRLWWDLPH